MGHVCINLKDVSRLKIDNDLQGPTIAGVVVSHPPLYHTLLKDLEISKAIALVVDLLSSTSLMIYVMAVMR